MKKNGTEEGNEKLQCASEHANVNMVLTLSWARKVRTYLTSESQITSSRVTSSCDRPIRVDDRLFGSLVPGVPAGRGGALPSVGHRHPITGQ